MFCVIIKPAKSGYAHRWFTLLDLPMYDSIDIIKEKLLTTIEHPEGFTLAWTLQLLTSPICDVLCNHPVFEECVRPYLLQSLDLPMYDSIDIIKEKLLTAIEHTEGFTLAWTLQLLTSPICDVLCNHPVFEECVRPYLLQSLDLPMYGSIEIIKEQLLTAIEHTEGFTLAWASQL